MADDYKEIQTPEGTTYTRSRDVIAILPPQRDQKTGSMVRRIFLVGGHTILAIDNTENLQRLGLWKR